MKKLFKVAIPLVLATGLLFSCANDSPASSNPPASQDEEKTSLTLQYAVNVEPIFPKEDCSIEAESEIVLPDGTYTLQQYSTYDSWGAGSISLETQELIYKAFTNDEIEFLNQYARENSSNNTVSYSLPVDSGKGSFIYKFSINDGQVSVTVGEGLNEVIINNAIILKFLKEASKYDQSDIGILEKSFTDNTLTTKMKFYTSGDFLKKRITDYMNCLKRASLGDYKYADKSAYLNSDSSKFYFEVPWSLAPDHIESYYIEKD